MVFLVERIVEAGTRLCMVGSVRGIGVLVASVCLGLRAIVIHLIVVEGWRQLVADTVGTIGGDIHAVVVERCDTGIESQVCTDRVSIAFRCVQVAVDGISTQQLTRLWSHDAVEPCLPHSAQHVFGKRGRG